MSETDPIYFRYKFYFANDHTVEYQINLDPKTLDFIPSSNQKIPEWARFDYLPCEQCVEQQDKSDHCPIATNIAEVVEALKDVYSYDLVDVIVETTERTYAKNSVPIQQALSSLMGIIMVSSGCEDLDKLRPLVRFHLPFATIQETIFRASSMYLLAQYFRQQEGMEPDWNMQELVDIYGKIDRINAKICKRLQIATSKDASMNAVVILDSFAQVVPFSIEDTLADFKLLFKKYLS